MKEQSVSVWQQREGKASNGLLRRKAAGVIDNFR
jgi:hypothetical protein